MNAGSSFAFHGPMPSWAEWAHDWSLAVLVVALVMERRPWLVAAAGAVGAWARGSLVSGPARVAA
ncbi:MAG: hypothetical protein GY788_07765 [bacterium]|nr:hypothetical protein [bacterium]